MGWRLPLFPLWNYLPIACETRLFILTTAFKTVLTALGHALDFRPMKVRRCKALSTRELARRSITLCLADQLDDDTAGTVDRIVARDHVILRGHPPAQDTRAW
jgi:hypothetical protein